MMKTHLTYSLMLFLALEEEQKLLDHLECSLPSVPVKNQETLWLRS